MELRLREILMSEQVLGALASEKLKTSTNWKIMKNLKKIQEETQIFETFKAEKIKQYGKFDEEQNDYILTQDNENYAVVVSELEELLNQTVNLDIQKIKLEEIENVELNVQQLFKIEWMIEE